MFLNLKKQGKDREFQDVLFTIEVAINFIVSMPNEQRKVVPSNLKELKDAVKRGEFRSLDSGTIKFVTDKSTGITYGIDGQHRSLLVKETGIPQVFLCENTYVENYQEVLKAYSVVNTGQRRTPYDLIRISGLHEKYNLEAHDIARMVAVARFISTGLNSNVVARKITKTKAENITNDWNKEMCSYNTLIVKAAASVKSRLKTAPVLSIALITLRNSPIIAEKFWTAVAENDRVPAGSPHASLIALLTSKNIHEFPVHVYARKVASAWNAAYENKEKLGILHGSSKIEIKPMKILGSEYNGIDTIKYQSPDS